MPCLKIEILAICWYAQLGPGMPYLLIFKENLKVANAYIPIS